jgi:hypothetical protein
VAVKLSRGPLRIASLGALALAVCLPAAASGAGLGKLHLAYEGNTTTTTVDPPAQNSVDSYHPCPTSPGTPSPFGGGFEIGGGGFGTLFANSSGPLDQIPGTPKLDSWRVVVDDIGSVSGQRSYTEHAVCGKVRALGYEKKTQATPDDKRTVIKATCPASKHVLGGGALSESTFPGAQRLVATAPFDSGDKGSTPDDGWKIAIDTMTQAGQHATAYASCGKAGGLHYLSRGFKAAFPSNDGLRQCPNGEWIVGGGIAQAGPFGKQALVVNSFDSTQTAWSASIQKVNISGKTFPFTVTAICHK